MKPVVLYCKQEVSAVRDIGKNIRQLRIEKNMTQDELAAALYVTRQTVSNYETGRSRPDVEMLERIAQVLGTDANAVLYGPPIPADRKAMNRKTAVYLLLTVVLGFGLLALTAALDERHRLYLDASGIRLLIIAWLVPAWKILAGAAAMQLLHRMVGLRRLQKPAAQHTRWCVIGILAAYAVLILPWSIYLLKTEMELYLLRQAGGPYSYSSSFSFVPFWDKAAATVLTMNIPNRQLLSHILRVLRTLIPVVAGALLWLCSKDSRPSKAQ